MPLGPDLCTDHVRISGGVLLLSPDGLRRWRAYSILAAAAWVFRLAGRRRPANGTILGIKLCIRTFVLRFVLCPGIYQVLLVGVH